MFIQNVHAYILVFILSLLSFTALSSSVFLADRLYKERNFEEAKNAYLTIAKHGNPHAYYQLANMYHKGLGTEKDSLNAMLYFYLAAEQDFHNSKEVIQNILSPLPVETQNNVLKILEDHRKEHGIDVINKRLFPVVVEQNLNSFVTFEGDEKLETVYHPEDIDMDDLYSDFNSDSFSDEDEDSSLELMMTPPKTPFLIIDHEVHKDGSVRYPRDVQKFGLHKSLLDEYVLFPIKGPEFDSKPVNFVSRTYLGAAAYSRFTMVEENEQMYSKILKQLRKYKSGDTLNDRFNLAMLMLNFPWITQEENEAERILLSLSELGHSPAMYEYGLKLYREQTNIEEAIKWISQASRYGLARAEYRLAKILQDSPWVEFDERKALYWYESASSKGDAAAKIRATDILINAQDKGLVNLSKAKKYLESLAASQSKNPEYFYLLALSTKTGENRDIKSTIDNLRKAISLGQFANWDTSNWQGILQDITAGTIRIVEE